MHHAWLGPQRTRCMCKMLFPFDKLATWVHKTFYGQLCAGPHRVGSVVADVAWQVPPRACLYRKAVLYSYGSIRRLYL